VTRRGQSWIATVCWSILTASQGYALELPAGTKLEIRLKHGLYSTNAIKGQRVEAIVVAPVAVNGHVAIPIGSVLSGTITHATKVGVGIVHERASIGLAFDRLHLPDSKEVFVQARLFGIENAREALDVRGRIKGIRSTNTPGYRAAGVLTGLAAVDPIALLFSTAAFSSTLRFSDPEIRWAPGAELIVELLAAIKVDPQPQARLDAVARDGSERRELLTLVRKLPYRTAKVSDGKPSDITNLLLIGKPESIARAFAAAGWVESHTSNAGTKYQSLRAFAETQPYQEAPMSALDLAGEPAVLTLSKTLNTFTRRHHLRLYAWNESWDGLAIFQASATHDTDIVMSLKQRTITHEIDSNIDEERSKVINDLAFTGCIDSSEWVERPWISQFLQNGSGQKIETDRSIAVLKFNECKAPYDGGVDRGTTLPGRGSLLERGVRHAVLRFRNDVVRGNLIWQSTSWAYRFSRMLRKPKVAEPEVYARQAMLASSLPANSESNDREDGSSLIAPVTSRPSISRRTESLGGAEDWGTPTVELGFSFGTSLVCQSTTGEEAWIFRRQQGTMRSALMAGNRIEKGWAVGGTVTVHASPLLSHELGFHYLRGTFEIGLKRFNTNSPQDIPGLVEQKTGLLTRQFSYTTLLHLRRTESRLRPYLAAGPALQLVHLTQAPFRDSRGIFRLGLRNVGMFRSAYNFANAPPLDGGGIFQGAMQFGGGLKFRYRKCWILRVDYRNTVSKRPDLLRKSLATVVEDLTPNPQVRTNAWFAQQRLTFGASFTF